MVSQVFDRTINSLFTCSLIELILLYIYICGKKGSQHVLGNENVGLLVIRLSLSHRCIAFHMEVNMMHVCIRKEKFFTICVHIARNLFDFIKLID